MANTTQMNIANSVRPLPPMFRNSYCLFFLLGFAACQHDYTPKPRGFQHIDLPKKEYELFDVGCPFTFEFPKYGVPVPDTDPKAEACWMNLHFPDYIATLHISYKDLTKTKLHDAIADSRTFVYKHVIKAEAIDEIPFQLDSQTGGIRYDLQGNTANHYQFYVTDRKNHFLRAALYFNAQTIPDSVEPVFEFLRADAEHLLKTLKWKN